MIPVPNLQYATRIIRAIVYIRQPLMRRMHRLASNWIVMSLHKATGGTLSSTVTVDSTGAHIVAILHPLPLRLPYSPLLQRNVNVHPVIPVPNLQYATRIIRAIVYIRQPLMRRMHRLASNWIVMSLHKATGGTLSSTVTVDSTGAHIVAILHPLPLRLPYCAPTSTQRKRSSGDTSAKLAICHTHHSSHCLHPHAADASHAPACIQLDRDVFTQGYRRYIIFYRHRRQYRCSHCCHSTSVTVKVTVLRPYFNAT